MTHKLTITDGIRKPLEREPGKPLRVRDEVTDRVYVIFDEQALPTLWDEYLRREVQRGVEQLDRGQGRPLDIEATIAEAHRRHEASNE